MLKYVALIMLLLPAAAHAQQKPKKGITFCGWRISDTSAMHLGFDTTLAFMRISDGDTIVDIGASSGYIEGVLSVVGKFRDVHFVLVDIDSNCLNRPMVDNMLAYYSGVKEARINNHFSLVINTVDSLYLPLQHYRHSWLLNTLHEIPDKAKLIRDIGAVLQQGGELLVMELLARPKHMIHGGCNQPLMDETQIKKLLEENGFVQADSKTWNPNQAKTARNPYYIVRFIKK